MICKTCGEIMEELEDDFYYCDYCNEYLDLQGGLNNGFC